MGRTKGLSTPFGLIDGGFEFWPNDVRHVFVCGFLEVIGARFADGDHDLAGALLDGGFHILSGIVVLSLIHI